MVSKRVPRLNSLLKEVIAEVLRKDIHHIENVSLELITITGVEITADLSYAKVFISILGAAEKKQQMFQSLQKFSGLIGSFAAKKVVMRHFPKLEFFLDETLDKQVRVQELLAKIANERESRREEGETHDESSDPGSITT